MHGDVPLGFPLRPGDTVVVKEGWFYYCSVVSLFLHIFRKEFLGPAPGQRGGGLVEIGRAHV